MGDERERFREGLGISGEEKGFFKGSFCEAWEEGESKEVLEGWMGGMRDFFRVVERVVGRDEPGQSLLGVLEGRGELKGDFEDWGLGFFEGGAGGGGGGGGE